MSQGQRWLLAPMRQWRSRRLLAAHGPTLSDMEAWCLVALAHDPADLPYVRALVTRQRMRSSAVLPPGVLLDVWAQLDTAEQRRRRTWLEKHRRTPLHRLGVPEELIELAGLRIIEWSLPPGCSASSLVVQHRSGPY